MSTIIRISADNTGASAVAAASVTSTAELVSNKNTDTIVISITDDDKNTMTTEQHHNDEGECEQNRYIMNMSFIMIDNHINREGWSVSNCILKYFIS